MKRIVNSILNNTFFGRKDYVPFMKIQECYDIWNKFTIDDLPRIQKPDIHPAFYIIRGIAGVKELEKYDGPKDILVTETNDRNFIYRVERLILTLRKIKSSSIGNY